MTHMASGASSVDDPRATLLLVVGAEGAPEFKETFVEWAETWKSLSVAENLPLRTIGQGEPDAKEDRELLLEEIQASTHELDTPLWLIFIGHGTYDGMQAKLNLRGPDVSALELKDWLAPIQRPLILINAASASGPFITALSATNRVILTSTRSGDEINYSRFGGYLSKAVGQPSADLDKDGQTSLLEAFLHAARDVEAFYKLEGRLATEHALIDDNHDGRGTPADWFQGVRAVKKAADGALPDGLRAHQIHLVPSERERRMPPDIRQHRDALEWEVAALRERKPDLEETVYYNELEELLVQLADVYATADATEARQNDAAAGIE